mgnify:CR=1 FL=1
MKILLHNIEYSSSIIERLNYYNYSVSITLTKCKMKTEKLQSISIFNFNLLNKLQTYIQYMSLQIAQLIEASSCLQIKY